MGDGLNRQQRHAAERAQARNSDFFAMVTVSGKIRISARSHNDARRVLKSVYSQPEGTVEMLFIEEVLEIQEGVLSAEEDSLFESAIAREAQRPIEVTVGPPSTRLSPAEEVYNRVMNAGDSIATSDISGLLEAVEHASQLPGVAEFDTLLRAAAAFREAKLKFDLNGRFDSVPAEFWDVIEMRMNGELA